MVEFTLSIIVSFNVHLLTLQFNTACVFKSTLCKCATVVECVCEMFYSFISRVLECQGLPIVNGQCDPYAAVSLLGPSRWDAPQTKKKNNELWLWNCADQPLLFLRFSQVGREKDKGEAENQQSPVWGSFLLWGLSELLQRCFATMHACYSCVLCCLLVVFVREGSGGGRGRVLWWRPQKVFDEVKHLRLFLQFLGYFGQTVYWRVTILTRGSIFVQNDLVCIQWLLNSVIWHCDPATWHSREQVVWIHISSASYIHQCRKWNKCSD